MTKSKGIGRGGARAGAGRKPKVLTHKEKTKPASARTNSKAIKPPAKGKRGGARPGAGAPRKVDSATAQAIGDLVGQLVSDAKARLQQSGTSPAQELEADAYATLHAAMKLVGVATAPAVTAARFVINTARVEAGKAPGDKPGKKESAQKTAADRAADGGRFAPPAPPGAPGPARH